VGGRVLCHKGSRDQGLQKARSWKVWQGECSFFRHHKDLTQSKINMKQLWKMIMDKKYLKYGSKEKGLINNWYVP
jgi:hypothetical protein